MWIVAGRRTLGVSFRRSDGRRSCIAWSKNLRLLMPTGLGFEPKRHSADVTRHASAGPACVGCRAGMVSRDRLGPPMSCALLGAVRVDRSQSGDAGVASPRSALTVRPTSETASGKLLDGSDGRRATQRVPVLDRGTPECADATRAAEPRAAPWRARCEPRAAMDATAEGQVAVHLAVEAHHIGILELGLVGVAEPSMIITWSPLWIGQPPSSVSLHRHPGHAHDRRLQRKSSSMAEGIRLGSSTNCWRCSGCWGQIGEHAIEGRRHRVEPGDEKTGSRCRGCPLG